MYSAHKLNKQGDNIQPWHTPFPVRNQSVVPCPVLTIVSWTAYWFPRRQVRWSGLPISWRFFHNCDPHSQRLWCNQQSRSRCFFYDPMDAGNLISCASAFSTSGSNIWKFMDCILRKPGLENFELSFIGMWDECSWVVVWTFFGIALLWDWNKVSVDIWCLSSCLSLQTLPCCARHS